ncbi:MAG: response regulator transcription factor [Bacteroidota bacterium]
MADPIKIFIADDHPVVRDGLISVLETQADFKIVGEAANGRVVLEALGSQEVDILFLDLAMPEMDGLEVIQQIRNRGLSTKVIVFTVFDTDERIMGAMRAGARGYLLKGASREEIFNAVRVVHSGGSLLQSVVASRLIDHISHPNDQLSLREMDVLRVLAEGLTNAQIGQRLFISERTVKFHVSAILSKLGAGNRTEAVQIALRKGIISI